MTTESKARELLANVAGLTLAQFDRCDTVSMHHAIAAVERALAQPVVGWRPIESAPRDGTFVLLTDNGCNPCWLIGRWKHDRWWGQPTPSGKSIVWSEASHWMPLPAPPGEQAQPVVDEAMVERVAEAMLVAAWKNDPTVNWQTVGECTKERYRRMARAALTAAGMGVGCG